MAKRKRLTPASLAGDAAPEGALETKATYPMGVAPGAVTRAPIAQVARDSATHAALEELVAEVDTARSTGRLVQDIALDDIKADHLLRDRMAADPEEMEALKASIAARGQQTPIEVVALEGGGYGLISGWRRIQALKALGQSSAQALIKPIDGVAESYVAMVEENEIRADLSFYERARLACEAAKLGVYPTAERAVVGLFAHAPSAKRSKIKSFIRVYTDLGKALRFPAAIPERLGLALSKALEADAGLAKRLGAALKAANPKDAAAERQVIETSLKAPMGAKVKAAAAEVIPGVTLEARKGRVVLSGAGVTPALQKSLEGWLKAQRR